MEQQLTEDQSRPKKQNKQTKTLKFNVILITAKGVQASLRI